MEDTMNEEYLLPFEEKDNIVYSFLFKKTKVSLIMEYLKINNEKLYNKLLFLQKTIKKKNIKIVSNIYFLESYTNIFSIIKTNDFEEINELKRNFFFKPIKRE